VAGQQASKQATLQTLNLGVRLKLYPPTTPASRGMELNETEGMLAMKGSAISELQKSFRQFRASENGMQNEKLCERSDCKKDQ